MIFVDTGYLIALVDQQDSLHSRAMAWDAFLREPLLVTEFVLLETVNFFSTPAARVKAHSMIDFIRQDKTYSIVPASASLFQTGLALHRRRNDQEWSLTDCSSFAVMQERGLTQALAYDHHFEQAGFEALLRRDPA